MFDTILNKIKDAVDKSVLRKLERADEECVIVNIEPQSYDGTVCDSTVKVVCIFKTYEGALDCFDKVCDALYSLPEDDGEVIDTVLESTVIRYDTASGMTRVLGDFSVFTAGEEE